MPTKRFIASRRSYAHTKNRLLALSRLRPAVTGEPTRFYELWWVAAAKHFAVLVMWRHASSRALPLSVQQPGENHA
jgi:hypothetical protein